MMNEATFKPDGLLVLPHLRVQNANAISSPLTWGFPSPTAFLGFAHALERRLRTGYDQAFGGVGIVCHSFEAQTFRPNRRQQLVFTQSRNPLYLKRDVAKFISEGTLMKNPANQTVVWVKTAAERFEPRVVTVEALDGVSVAITAGLKAADRVVTQAATLINQIR